MAKIIEYKLSREVNHGTEEKPNVEQVIFLKKAICKTQADFDISYPIVENEAIPGTIEVSGEFDPEPETPETGDMVTWSELNNAYQEGVDSV